MSRSSHFGFTPSVALLVLSVFLLAISCTSDAGVTSERDEAVATERDEAVIFAVRHAAEKHEELSSGVVQGRVFSSVTLDDAELVEERLSAGDRAFQLFGVRPGEQAYLEIRSVESIGQGRWSIELAAVSGNDFFGASFDVVRGSNGDWRLAEDSLSPSTTSVS